MNLHQTKAAVDATILPILKNISAIKGPTYTAALRAAVVLTLGFKVVDQYTTDLEPGKADTCRFVLKTSTVEAVGAIAALTKGADDFTRDYMMLVDKVLEVSA